MIPYRRIHRTLRLLSQTAEILGILPFQRKAGRTQAQGDLLIPTRTANCDLDPLFQSPTDLPKDKYSLQAVKTGYLGVPPGHYVLNQVNQNNGGIARSTMIDLTRGTVDADATSANFDSDQT